MLLPRESSQTPKQLQMKISKIKVRDFIFFGGVAIFGKQPLYHLSTFLLSFIDVLLLIKKRPPPTLPKMVDVGSEEKVGTDQKHFFIYIFFGYDLPWNAFHW